MGRYRRNRRRRNGGKGHQGPRPFRDKERQTLVDYLTVYRDQTLSESPHQAYDQRQIGDVLFPELSDKVFSSPFLALPTTLSKSHRKTVHEVCIELGLFHGSVGKEDERQAVVSPYVDGFSGLDIESRQDETNSLFKYKQWFYLKNQVESRRNRLLSSEEMDARDSIQALIDQPSFCIRDHLDDIKLDETISLSHMVDPAHIPWTFIDTVEAMDNCLVQLRAIPRISAIGFDLEAYNQSKACQLTCLLQLAVEDSSGSASHFIFDTLADGIWVKIRELAPFFADSSIVKIGHAIGSLDVQCLHRDFGIFVVNAFDTHEASKILRISDNGLVACCEYYGLANSLDYKSLKAIHQAGNWRERPLSQDMIRYGRYDVTYLIALRKLMLRDLAREAQTAEADEVAAAAALSELVKQFDDEDGVDSKEALSSDGAFSMEDECVSDKRDNKAADDEPDEIDETSSFQTSFEDRESISDVSYLTARAASIGKKLSTSFESDNDGPVHSEDTIVSALSLRLQVDVMRVVSISQERCLKLWRETTETRDVNLPGVKATLFKRLMTWRDELAFEFECLPSLLVSFDYLVGVALTGASSTEELKRVSTRTPQLFVARSDVQSSMFAIVDSLKEEEGELKTAIPYFYGNHKVQTRQRSFPGRAKTGRKGPRLAWTWVAVVAIGCGIAAIALNRRSLRLK